MRKLKFTDDAITDLAEIAVSIAEQSGFRNAGRRFARRLRERCAELASQPGTMGRPRDELSPGLRSVAFGNYVIFFRYREDMFDVTAIVDGRRDIEELFRGES